MIETPELQKREIDDISDLIRPRYIEQHTHHVFERGSLPGQVLRFGLVGGLNTLVDLLILNGLLWLFPTTSSLTVDFPQLSVIKRLYTAYATRWVNV